MLQGGQSRDERLHVIICKMAKRQLGHPRVKICLLQMPEELICLILSKTEDGEIFLWNQLCLDVCNLIKTHKLFEKVDELRCFYDPMASPRQFSVQPRHLLQMAPRALEWAHRDPFDAATLIQLAPSLTALSLDNLDVHQCGIGKVLWQLTNLTKLQCFELESHSGTKKKSAPRLNLGPVLGGLTQLQYLEIDGTCCFGVTLKSVDFLHQLTALVHLKLDVYPVGSADVLHLTRLQHVHLDRDSLNASLNTLPSLTRVYVSRDWDQHPNHVLPDASFLDSRILLQFGSELPSLFSTRTKFCRRRRVVPVTEVVLSSDSSSSSDSDSELDSDSNGG